MDVLTPRQIGVRIPNIVVPFDKDQGGIQAIPQKGKILRNHIPAGNNEIQGRQLPVFNLIGSVPDR